MAIYRNRKTQLAGVPQRSRVDWYLVFMGISTLATVIVAWQTIRSKQ